MFNNGFFPTPAHVIDRMVAPLLKGEGSYRTLPYKTILEPSAGKGDIVDRLVNRYHRDAKNVSCIEIEAELQHILLGKGYRLIESDFLAYCERYTFDLVIMNPPFAEGVDHLLKAWDILKSGDIVCLLNAETLLNPHTGKRKLLAGIIAQHGRYEVIGPVFKNAERPTDVEVAIVWLHKDSGSSGIHFDAADVDRDTPVSESEFNANPIAPANMVQALVAQYERAADLLVQMSELESQYRYYTQDIRDALRDNDTLNKTSLNERLDGLKASFWRYVFDKTRLGKVATSNYRNTFEEFVANTSRMAFSEQNVMLVIEKFYAERHDIITACIVEVFDKATQFHEKNTVHTEGWKTNKSWRIAPKIIMPWGISFDTWGWSSNFGSRARDFYGDLDKAMCFLSGQSIDDVTTIDKAIHDHIHAIHRGDIHYADLFSSTFFDIRIFKKGTVHLIFRDTDLHARFNQVAAQGKKWVGAGY